MASVFVGGCSGDVCRLSNWRQVEIRRYLSDVMVARRSTTQELITRWMNMLVGLYVPSKNVDKIKL